MVVLPIQRIIRSRFSETFFVFWSLLQIGLIGGMVSYDGGASSPRKRGGGSASPNTRRSTTTRTT